MPDAIKIARGTLRADRTGEPSTKPQPVAAFVESPASLGEFGRAKWDEKGPELMALGVLTSLDHGAFEQYCRSFDEVSRLDAVIATGPEFYFTEKGTLSQHPAVNQRFKWLELRRRYEAEFGMTPSSRSGVIVNKPAASSVMKRNRA